MKKFETLSNREILNAAYFYYLDEWYKEVCFLAKNPLDCIAKVRESKLKKILDELHAEVINLENQ